MQKTLYTIGYEGITVQAFIRALKDAGVKTLIDVRAVPMSRKPGFSKNKLAGFLADAGIGYLGLRGLGTPAAGRDAARKGRVKEMHKIFRAHMKTKEAKEDLAAAIDTAQKTKSCLLCFEHDARTCHRLLIADDIAASTGMKVRHLDPQLPL
ncbi:MAG TPA: DUF488 domain-containing protein [Patescibacteria group bacterium]|nr:DUF488 domain-containing protein [Patescibacteria group bacterium]